MKLKGKVQLEKQKQKLELTYQTHDSSHKIMITLYNII